MPRSYRNKILSLICFATLWGAPASADEPEPTEALFDDVEPQRSPGSPFSVRLTVDLPIIIAAGTISLTAAVIQNELPGPSCGSSCDPQSLNPLDRTVVGYHSAAARVASDALVGINIGLPFALDLIDVLANHPPDGFRGYGQDVLVLAEVLAVNFGLNAVVKFAVRRPRPFVYDPDMDAVSAADRQSPDAGLSFYSEHSSTSFAMATAYSYLFMRRHPGSKLIVPVWLVSEGMAATTALLRVFAGKHFYTDVITGALVGSALGLLIPYLHQRALPASMPAFASRLRFSAIPLAYSGGGGLLLTVE